MRNTKLVIENNEGLLLSEEACLEALEVLVAKNPGRIPKGKEVAEAMGNVVKVSHISKLVKGLEEKGYIQRQLVILRKSVVRKAVSA